MRASIDKLLLIPAKGQTLDIRSLVFEINVYQDLYDHYMHCDLVVLDSTDIAGASAQDVENWINGGFTGLDTLLFQYSPSGGIGTQISNLFMLYERSARSIVKDGMWGYVLSGVSLESYQSFSKKISRAYGGSRGNTIDKMIESITKEYLYNRAVRDDYNSIKLDTQTVIEKNIFIEPTIGAHRFVIPTLSVDDTIEFLANEADSTSHIPQYLFYENYQGFNFRNLETLISLKPRQKFALTAFNLNSEYTRPTGADKIINYSVVKENNLLEKVRDGMFKSKVIQLDVLKKRKVEQVWDYAKGSTRFTTLQSFRHEGNVDDSNANVTLITTRNGHDCQCMVFKKENHLPKRIDQFIAARKAYMKHIFNTTLDVEVAGTTALDVGNNVYLKFPISDGLEDREDLVDTQLTGKYIVTKIRNQFSGISTESEMKTIFRCSKDTQIQL